MIMLMMTWTVILVLKNLDIMVGLMEEHSELQSEVVKLCNLFVDDMGERMKTLDLQYLTGLEKFFTTYLETIDCLHFYTHIFLILKNPLA